MAGYYLSRLVQEEGLEDIIAVESAGTWAIKGQPAAELSQLVCAEKDLDLSAHRSQPIDLFLIKNSDLVLCMAAEHKNDLNQIFPHFKHKIFTLREYANKSSPKSISIADPYGQSVQRYRETCQLITGEIHRIFPSIKQNAREKCLVS
jgi:protein-tyrosine phosphatase